MHFTDGTFRVHRQADKRVLADIESNCARVRLLVDPGAVSGGGFGLVLGGVESTFWVPAKGPVTWEDGTPAGRWIGTEPLEDIREVPEKKPASVCESPRPIAGWLCHPLRTTKRKKATTVRRED
jgi:hypothetical protein